MSSDDANLYRRLVPSIPDGKRTALITPDGERISYARLDELSARYADVLADAGLLPDERLLAITAKSVASVVLYLATLRAGGIYVPLNDGYTSAELRYFAEDAAPTVVVTDPDRAAEVGEACGSGARVLTLDDSASGTLDIAARSRSGDHDVVHRRPEDLAAILYTSGTTGRSKGAMLSHGNLLANARALQQTWGYTEEDVLLHALPIFHTHGLFVGINVSFLSRASVLMLPRFDAETVAGLLPRATVLMGVPTYYHRLLQTDGLRDRCRGIRLFVSGSAPLASADHRAWSERTGHEILERYGMTETTMLTSNPLDGPRRPGAVGTPLPGVDVRIADADEEGIGMIQVSGPNVFRGYWGMPEKTAEEFTADGYFITGDLGRIGSDGYLQIVGRAKDLVITGGYNVYPKEIESVIDSFDGVAESAVFGAPDPDLGERVVAAVVPRAGVEFTGGDLGQFVAGQLASYKRPRDFVYLPELPRNVMGKIQKTALRESYAVR